ncbi:MAG: hypothetical protein KJ737_26915 [Proteobacteria bacterium]|nr:hypothetical protein [Pseudomonadota bacterium]
MRVRKKQRIFLACLFLVIRGALSHCQETDNKLLHHIETKYTILTFTGPDHVKDFSKKIKYGSNQIPFGKLFRKTDTAHMTEQLKSAIDLLFEKVQQILDMRKKMPKVNIRVCEDNETLQQAFFRYYNTDCTHRAWYIYETNTIYLNLKDVNSHILAHEMAHSIINHYLLIRPPHASAEILARYVDTHLE